MKRFASTDYAERFEFQHLWNRKDVYDTVPALIHKDFIWSMDVSPDGKSVATASEDGRIRLWDANSLKLINWTIFDEYTYPRWITFSPDGQRIACANDNGDVGIWQVKGLRPLFPGKLHHGHAGVMAFSINGDRLYLPGPDNSVSVVDFGTESSPISSTLHQHHQASVSSVVCSPDGRLLASTDQHGNVVVWNLESQRVETTLPGRGQNIYWMPTVFSRDGSRLIVCGHNVKVWSTRHWELIGRLEVERQAIFAAACSGEDRLLALGMRGTIRVFDLNTLEEVYVTATHAGVIGIEFVGDTQTLATTSSHTGNNRVRFWNLEELAPHLFEPRSNGTSYRTLAFRSPGGHSSLVVAGPIIESEPMFPGVFEIAVTENRVARLLHDGDGTTSIAFVPTDDHLFIAAERAESQSYIAVWDLRTTTRLKRVPIGDRFALRMTNLPSRNQVFALTYSKHAPICELAKWDLQSGNETSFASGPMISGYDISPDERRVAFTYGTWRDGIVRVADLDVPNRCFELHADADLLGAEPVAFSPAGDHLAVGYHQGETLLWNLSKRKPTRSWRCWSGPVIAIAYSPDGRLIAAGYEDDSLRFLDTQTGMILAAIQLHSKPTELAFSPDSEALAIGFDDGSVVVWDRQGKEMRFSRHRIEGKAILPGE